MRIREFKIAILFVLMGTMSGSVFAQDALSHQNFKWKRNNVFIN
jgi:hypothetical protein